MTNIDDVLDNYYQERTLDIIKRKTFMAKIDEPVKPAEWHTKAKQALYSDILELIGEDDKLYPQDGGMVEASNIAFTYQNDLRQQQRQVLKEYFNL